jgi:16S rRNA (guanine966-N2)-methyltransferase
VTRIVAGVAGGRRLATPAGTATRPTSERVREALASALEPVQGLAVLDLCAGSGAVGLELLSRGAATVTLVDPVTAWVIRANAQALDLPQATVAAVTAEVFLGGPPTPYDIVFLDPPYADPVDHLLAALSPWLAPGALIVVERDRRSSQPVWPPGFSLWRSKKYGDTVLWYGRQP